MILRLFILLPIASVLLFLYGALINIGYIEENRCRMTYMFEPPRYIRIPVRGNELFPKYALYAYSEGIATQRVQERFFTGAPVLFIPGNAGSYKQVRSLASVALRKGIDNNWQAHLDYFAVDLNEELSGLYGGFLQEQTRFIRQCIRDIVQLYVSRAKQTKIIIIGHSVGGKLAQAVIADEGIARYVTGIITISTPVDKPVALVDHYHQSFYDRVEQSWNANRTVGGLDKEARKPLDDIFFLTIGGGIRDIIVHDGLTVSKYNDLHAMTHNIAKVWLSVDHLCAVWCLEFILVVNRFLYSLIVPAGRNAHAFVEGKDEKLSKALQFLGPPGIKAAEESRTIYHTPENELWVEDVRRSFTQVFRDGLNRTRVQMIPLVSKPAYRYLRAEAVNFDLEDWVSGCAALDMYADFRSCLKSTSLDSYVIPIPSSKFDRTGVLLDLQGLKTLNPRWTHVLLKFPRNFKPAQFSVDMFDDTKRELNLYLPHWYDFTRRTILRDISVDDSYYRINILDMQHTYQSMAFEFTTVACNGFRGSVVAHIQVPWADGFDRYVFHEDFNKSVVYVYPPLAKPHNFDSFVYIDLHLSPGCRYHMQYSQSLRLTAARIVQQYLTLLPSHCIALLLLAFKDQLTQSTNDQAFAVGTLKNSITKLSPLVTLFIGTPLLNKFLTIFNAIPTPETLDTPLLVSILLHTVASGALIMLTVGMYVVIAFCANFSHKIIIRLIALPIPAMSSTLLSCINKFPIAIGILLIAISFTACGGASLLCAVAVYFVLLSKIYEDYLENIVFRTAKLIGRKLFGAAKKPATQEGSEERPRRHRKRTSESTDELMMINFHLPLFLLVIIMALLNLPSVITWAKNYTFNTTLQPDASLVPSLVVLTCLSVLWQMNTPRNVYGYELIAALIVIIAFVCTLYCQVHLYRSNYAIGLVFIAITVHQLVAPKRPEERSG